MATDTLIMFTEVGDALCADIVEPVGHWRIFFRDSFELGELLVEAAEHEGLSVESVRAVLADSLAPILAFHERRMRTSWVDEPPRMECARPSVESPTDGRGALHGCRSADAFFGLVKFVGASLLLASLGFFWLWTAALAWRAWR